VEKGNIPTDRINAIQCAQSELSRCLRLLVTRFQDTDFVATPPTLNIIDGYPPLQKTLGATVNRTWQNAESVPMLRLTGKWLRQLGFHESSRMRIEARYGQLTIQARDL
jgi:hypothetical protein